MKLVSNYKKLMWGYGGGYGGMMGGYSTFSLFGLITWGALLTFLVLGIIYFWKEINKPKSKR